MNKYTCEDKIVVKDYCCINCFVKQIVKELNDTVGDYISTSVIANEDFTQDLMKILLSDEYCYDMAMITYDGEEYSGEYIVTITSNMEVWCEPAYRDNQYGKGYIYGEADHAYVLEDSNFKVLDKIGCDDITIFGFED